MPKDLPTEEDPCAFPCLRLSPGNPRFNPPCTIADIPLCIIALHPVPFQFTEEDETTTSLPETGGAGESKIKMILGLLKK